MINEKAVERCEANEKRLLSSVAMKQPVSFGKLLYALATLLGLETRGNHVRNTGIALELPRKAGNRKADSES